MKAKKILSVICVSALVASAMTTCAYAETDVSEAPAEAVEADMIPGATLFEKGVWSLSKDGEITMYLVFATPAEGQLLNADGKSGVPFVCEQNGSDMVFHLGGADDTTLAECSEGDNTITFTYESGETATYTVEYIDGADPETFTVEVPEETGSPLFKKGVWSLSKDGEIAMYLVFTAPSEGGLLNADGKSGVPFACEQNGFDMVFHLGGADDTTLAECSEGDNTITFTYENGETATYTVEYIDGADPETFTVDVPEAVEDGYGMVPEELYETDGYNPTGINEDGTFTVNGADIRSVCAESPDAMVYVTFSKLGSFELFFDFTTNSGAVKRYTVLSNRTIDYVAYVPINDMLTALGITADDVQLLTVSGTSVSDVTEVSLDRKVLLAVSDGDDINPGTGAELPIAVAGVFGAAALASLALRRKNK